VAVHGGPDGYFLVERDFAFGGIVVHGAERITRGSGV
jgi:hypothetical protein